MAFFHLKPSCQTHRTKHSVHPGYRLADQITILKTDWYTPTVTRLCYILHKHTRPHTHPHTEKHRDTACIPSSSNDWATDHSVNRRQNKLFIFPGPDLFLAADACLHITLVKPVFWEIWFFFIHANVTFTGCHLKSAESKQNICSAGEGLFWGTWANIVISCK